MDQKRLSQFWKVLSQRVDCGTHGPCWHMVLDHSQSTCVYVCDGVGSRPRWPCGGWMCDVYEQWLPVHGGLPLKGSAARGWEYLSSKINKQLNHVFHGELLREPQRLQTFRVKKKKKRNPNGPSAWICCFKTHTFPFKWQNWYQAASATSVCWVVSLIITVMVPASGNSLVTLCGISSTDGKKLRLFTAQTPTAARIPPQSHSFIYIYIFLQVSKKAPQEPKSAGI